MVQLTRLQVAAIKRVNKNVKPIERKINLLTEKIATFNSEIETYKTEVELYESSVKHLTGGLTSSEFLITLEQGEGEQGKDTPLEKQEAPVGLDNDIDTYRANTENYSFSN